MFCPQLKTSCLETSREEPHLSHRDLMAPPDSSSTSRGHIWEPWRTPEIHPHPTAQPMSDFFKGPTSHKPLIWEKLNRHNPCYHLPSDARQPHPNCLKAIVPGNTDSLLHVLLCFLHFDTTWIIHSKSFTVRFWGWIYSIILTLDFPSFQSQLWYKLVFFRCFVHTGFYLKDWTVNEENSNYHMLL